MKPMKNYNATAGTNGESGPGANTNGVSTSGMNIGIITITTTETIIGIATKLSMVSSDSIAADIKPGFPAALGMTKLFHA